MKKIRFIQAALLLLFSASVSFAAQPDSRKEVIHVNSARFAAPLVEKWASEFEKANQSVEITVSIDPTAGKGEFDLYFVGSASEKDDHAGQAVIYTGRYALLPVTNEKNPLLNELGRKGLNSKKLEELFFEASLSPGYVDSPKEQQQEEITIYSGNNSDSFAGLFASHFGYSPADIRGKRISGNDIYLINAVQKDNAGATFNSLGYLFDTGTRALKSGLALLPLDLKKEQQEALSSANVDQTIALLEKESIPLIPVEHIGFAYQSDNASAKRFLNWVLEEGQKHNREFGFLKTESDLLAEQLKKTKEPHYSAAY
jgi:ABC-type phosphate transport system substrate-binding protein